MNSLSFQHIPPMYNTHCWGHIGVSKSPYMEFSNHSWNYERLYTGTPKPWHPQGCTTSIYYYFLRLSAHTLYLYTLHWHTHSPQQKNACRIKEHLIKLGEWALPLGGQVCICTGTRLPSNNPIVITLCHYAFDHEPTRTINQVHATNSKDITISFVT